jgi:hypothetical protein
LDTNQKWIFGSIFIAGLVGTYIAPITHKTIVSELPPQWLAFQALFSAATSLIIGMIWKGRFRKTVTNGFVIFCISECFAGFLCGMYLCFYEFNAWVFAVVTLIYTNLITILVSKCIMTFKTKMWNERAREDYDNNLSIVISITCILGYGTALIAMPTIKTAMFLWGVSCIFDDIGWIVVYLKNKSVLKTE